ncbi:hypothetical protein FSP39_012097 [Pinctada imbricata]|uniref:Uncharacterized protein n=1 Tax=Pinctada imbricata TaxID=66713 RepID=A0AA89CCP8_PINIB|nr:hypothetical protein FSP39_012097 [Pinctada imbricata]
MAAASLPDVDTNMEVRPDLDFRHVRSLTSVAISQYEERVQRYVVKLASMRRNLDCILMDVSEKRYVDFSTASAICTDIS